MTAKCCFVLESFTDAMIQPLVDMKPREIIAIDGVFNDSDHAQEQSRLAVPRCRHQVHLPVSARK
jgi:hypothetical protein